MQFVFPISLVFSLHQIDVTGIVCQKAMVSGDFTTGLMQTSASCYHTERSTIMCFARLARVMPTLRLRRHTNQMAERMGGLREGERNEV